MHLAPITALKAAAFAGSLAGVVGAILYLATACIYALVHGGFAREISDAVAVAIYLSLFGTVGGFAAGVVVGFPLLVLLTRARANRPSIASVLGAAVSIVAAVAIAPAHASLQWPVMFGVVGAFCGAVASYMSAIAPSSNQGPSAIAPVEP